MLKRLFFLLPDEAQAQRVVNQLISRNIARRHIHAIAQGVELTTLPEASERQKKDTAFRVEWFLWNANLLLFAVACTALLVSLVAGAMIWSGVSLLLMLASFIAGQQFVVRVPDVHLTEFTDALSHGEILLMIDVPGHRVAEIEHFVHQHHPAAVVGGVSWSIDAFGL